VASAGITLKQRDEDEGFNSSISSDKDDDHEIIEVAYNLERCMWMTTHLFYY
jgi:hypothetical protein